MELRQRTPRIRDEPYLKFIRSLPCTACGRSGPSQAAHIRFSDFASGSTNPGVGCKPDDSKAVPLCANCHTDGPGAQHRSGERRFWTRVGKDPFEIAERLYGLFRATAGPFYWDAPGQTEPEPRRRRPKLINRPKRNAPRVAYKSTAKRKWPSRPFPAGRKFRS
jgi:hypothetical protein